MKLAFSFFSFFPASGLDRAYVKSFTAPAWRSQQAVGCYEQIWGEKTWTKGEKVEGKWDTASVKSICICTEKLWRNKTIKTQYLNLKNQRLFWILLFLCLLNWMCCLVTFLVLTVKVVLLKNKKQLVENGITWFWASDWEVITSFFFLKNCDRKSIVLQINAVSEKPLFNYAAHWFNSFPLLACLGLV